MVEVRPVVTNVGSPTAGRAGKENMALGKKKQLPEGTTFTAGDLKRAFGPYTDGIEVLAQLGGRKFEFKAVNHRVVAGRSMLVLVLGERLKIL